VKPAIIILLFTVLLSTGCTAPRYLSYDKLKPHHHVARINQKDHTVVQVNSPLQVRAVKNDDYLELYYPRKMEAENRVLLISIHADDILDIFVSKTNNPNAMYAEENFWYILFEIILFWL